MTATTTRENRWASAGGRTPGGRPGGTSSPKDSAPAEEPAAKKTPLLRSKKFVIAVVVALAVGGGAYKTLAPKKAGPPQPGQVVAMDATTLNLADGHYLKIAVAIQLVKGAGGGGKGSAGGEFSTSHAAELVIDEFSNLSVESLASNAARQKHTAHLLAQIQKAYEGEVFDIFLTQFVMQ